MSTKRTLGQKYAVRGRVFTYTDMELYQTITERSMHLIKEGLKYILGVDFLI